MSSQENVGASRWLTLAGAAIAGMLVFGLVAYFLVFDPSDEGNDALAAPVAEQNQETAPPQNRPGATAPGSRDVRESNHLRNVGDDRSNAAQPPLVITGIVYSLETRRPIAEATVSIHPLPLSILSASETLDGWITTETNETGEYRLELDASRFSRTQGDTKVLRAHADGHAGQAAMLMGHISLPMLNEFEQHFDLAAGGVIEGRVVDESGLGVGGALVGGINLTGGTFSHQTPTVPSAFALADSSGRFRLDHVPANEGFRLVAQAPGYAPGRSEEIEAGATGVEIVLGRANAALSGVVLSHEGDPLGNGHVFLYSAVTDGEAGHPAPVRRYHRLESDGRFHFDSLAGGDYRVMAVLGTEYEMDYRRMQQEMVSLGSEDEEEIEIRMPAPVTVRGKVVYAPHDSPMSGVVLTSGSMFQDSLDNTAPVPDGVDAVMSRADGTFELSIYGAPENALSITVAVYPPKGFMVSNEVTTRHGGGYRVQLMREATANDIDDAVILIDDATMISGRVVNPDGSGASGASVHGYQRTNSYNLDSVNATAGDDGRFTVILHYDGPVNLRAQATGMASAGSDFEVDGEDIVLTLKELGVVSGRVVDSQGSPVDRVLIGYANDRTVRGAGWADFNMTRVEGVYSDQDGAFRLRGIPPGAGRLEVNLGPDSELALKEPVTFVLELGESIDGVEVVLGMGDYLEGLVMNEDSEPVHGATVLAYAHHQSATRYQRSVTTDRSGGFRFSGMAEGTRIVLSINHPEYGRAVRDNLTVMDGFQEIVLARSGTTELLVVDAETNEPVPRYDYRVTYANARMSLAIPQRQITNPDGRTQLQLLSEGDYRVEVIEIDAASRSATGRMGAADFSVTSETQEIVVRLSPGRTLSGIAILDDDGSPMEGVRVTLSSQRLGWVDVMQREQGGRSVVTGSDGRFEFDELTPGRYYPRAWKDDASSAPLAGITVTADSDPDPLTIRMLRGVTVYGRVIGADGEPVAEADVTGMSAADGAYNMGEMWNTTTDEAGVYRIVGMPAGSAQFVAVHEPTALNAMRGIELPAGGEIEVDIIADRRVTVRGRVTMNGERWPSGLTLVAMPNSPLSVDNILDDMTSGRQAVLLAPTAGDPTSYEAHMRPGEYVVRGIGNHVWTSMTVEAQPAEQTINLDLTGSSIDVVVSNLDGSPIRFRSSSRVTFERRLRNGQIIDNVHTMRLDRERIHMGEFPAGEYRATAHHDDETAVSEWTTTGPGEENVIVVFLGEDSIVQVGQWTPDTITTQTTELMFDLSPHATSAGPREFRFEYRGGNNAAVIESAEIIGAGGSVVSADHHVAWAGAQLEFNIYHLEVPASGGTLRVRMRGHGGNDSEGVILMRRP